MNCRCQKCPFKQFINQQITDDQIKQQYSKLLPIFEKYQEVFNLITASLQLQVMPLLTVLSILASIMTAFIMIPENILLYGIIVIDSVVILKLIYQKLLTPIIMKLYKPYDEQAQQVEKIQMKISKISVIIKFFLNQLVKQQDAAKKQVAQIITLIILTYIFRFLSLRLISIIFLASLMGIVFAQSLMSNKEFKDRIDRSINSSISFIEEKATEIKQKIQNIGQKQTQKQQPEQSEEKPQEVSSKQSTEQQKQEEQVVNALPEEKEKEE